MNKTRTTMTQIDVDYILEGFDDVNIGSHNTFTYLPVRQWWLRPFAFMARCQRVDYLNQIVRYNVRLLDLRVRFSKTGELRIAHGLMEYKITSQEIFKILRQLNIKELYKLYIRVVLETNKRDEFQEKMFRNFCETIEEVYTNLTFFGGNNRLDWHCSDPIYKFYSPIEDLDDKYSSTTTLFPGKKRWLKFLDDLCPILYAKKFNKNNIQAGTKHKWLFMDFVDIQ